MLHKIPAHFNRKKSKTLWQLVLACNKVFVVNEVDFRHSSVGDRSDDPQLDHIKQVIANDDNAVYEYILNWFASIVQHPEIQTRVAILLRGGQGCGKNSFTDLLSEVLSGYSLANVDSLTDVT
ncbi:MAG: hypothetical protein EZS28_050447, partial [Streblomastix strix]